MMHTDDSHLYETTGIMAQLSRDITAAENAIEYGFVRHPRLAGPHWHGAGAATYEGLLDARSDCGMLPAGGWQEAAEQLGTLNESDEEPTTICQACLFANVQAGVEVAP